MRGQSSVAILGAVICIIAAVAAVLFAKREQPATADPGIVVTIPDNPAALAATKAQEAEQVVSLPSAAEPKDQVSEEATAAQPAPPEKLQIADEIRAKLNDATLRKGAHADDLAALESFYAQYSGPTRWVTSTGLSPEAQAVVGEIAKADDWGLVASSFAVPPAEFKPQGAEDQAATEVAIDLAILAYARAARGGVVEPSTVSKVFAQAPLVRDPTTVLTEVVASPTPDAYLRDLHPKHEQFERLHRALLKAREAGAKPEDIKRLVVNMERWRWMPENLGATYVWLNIPEFMVYVVKDGKTVESENAVVGNPGSPTPVLSADLKSIVFNPERTVPLSVIHQGVLPALKKGKSWFGGNDTSVLERYQLTVKYKGKPIDPDGIDWEKANPANFTFVQAPGPTNILGKVQFLYPNPRDVYMHDTILPAQLGRAVRAEGQQEPRVGNPEKLAGLLLGEDKGWNQAKVDKLIADRKTVEVKIDKPLPVHTTYFTVVVDDNGKVKTFGDVYKLDDIDKRDDAADASPPPVAGTAPIPSRKPVNGSLAATAQ
jgi:murein L,D-transpeptidase YcbB/YkuD